MTKKSCRYYARQMHMSTAYGSDTMGGFGGLYWPAGGKSE